MILEKDKEDRTGIWWIASYPKSGNTWIRMFVNALVTGFPPNINSAFQYATGDTIDRYHQRISSIPFQKMTTKEIIIYRHAVLLNMLAEAYPRDLCLKTHMAHVMLEDTPMHPSNLTKGALYIIRDPRDVVISLAKHTGKTIDGAIDFMNEEQARLVNPDSPVFSWLATWSEHVKSWTEDNNLNTNVVKYEDLLEGNFDIVVESLALQDFDYRREWALEQSSFEKLQEQEEEDGFVETGGKQEKFFNSGQSGKWQDILTAEQIERIENDHLEIMRKFNYL